MAFKSFDENEEIDVNQSSTGGFKGKSDEELDLEKLLKLVDETAVDKAGYRIEIPELNPNVQNDLSFNWRAAYEAETGKKLDYTIEDEKTLGQYILSKVNSKDNLIKLAHDMHLFSTKDGQSWADFIQTPNGKELMKAVNDIAKIKQHEDIENIWNDGTASNVLTQLTLPVARNYAMENYENLPTSYTDMASAMFDGDRAADAWKFTGALGFDGLSNIAMMGLGGKVGNKVASKAVAPYLSFGIDNTAAPVITESGNIIMNNEDISDALKNVLLGISTNLATPRKLNTGLHKIGVLGNVEKNAEAQAQAMANQAANRSRAIEKQIRSGKPYWVEKPHIVIDDIMDNIKFYKPADFDLNDVFYNSDNILKAMPNEYSLKNDAKNLYGILTTDIKKLDNPFKNKRTLKQKGLDIDEEGRILQPEEAIKQNDVITPADVAAYKEGIPLRRDRETFAHDVERDLLDKNIKSVRAEKIVNKAKTSLEKHGDLSDLKPDELYILGQTNKETLYNYLSDKYGKEIMDGILSNYGTNLWGRPEFGQRIWNGIFPVRDYLMSEDDSKQTNLSPNIQYLLKLNKNKGN